MPCRLFPLGIEAAGIVDEGEEFPDFPFQNLKMPVSAVHGKTKGVGGDSERADFMFYAFQI